MKIYAHSIDKFNIDQIVGKELWVACHYADNIHQLGYYCRVKSTSPSTTAGDPWMTINLFPAEWVYDDAYHNVTEVLVDYVTEWIERPQLQKRSDIVVDNPVQILTTEELYEIMGIPL